MPIPVSDRILAAMGELADRQAVSDELRIAYTELRLAYKVADRDPWEVADHLCTAVSALITHTTTEKAHEQRVSIR